MIPFIPPDRGNEPSNAPSGDTPHTPSGHTSLPPQSYQSFFLLAGDLLASGVAPAAVEHELQRRGLDHPTAAAIVAEARDNPDALTAPSAGEVQRRVQVSTEAAQGGQGKMMLGALICGIGMVVTCGSMAAVGSGGGSYVIAWGAVLYGAFLFIQGLSQSRQ